jgi:glutamine synthetase
VLVTCDRTIFFRYMVHVLAQQRGKLATFMPKPFSHLTGNGCHFHLSLWEEDRDVNLFGDDADARGFGLSQTAYHFMAGVLDHAAGLSALLAPTVNSYKRIGVGAPASGATWSPAYAAWGGNNRTQLIRVPGGARFEHRGVDGSANPYLAATAILAAGLDGIERRLDPGAPNTRNLYATAPAEVLASGVRQLPTTLLEACEALSRDDVLRDWLGATAGEDYVDYFVRTKSDEFRAWHADVSEWEVSRYLTAF